MVKMKVYSVVLLLVCVVKCYGMVKSEIEDFSNFLRKTSALDQDLKDGSHSDENEDVSDHAWEESGKFEGDLILNERQRRLIVEDVADGLARNGLQDSTKRWPDNEVIVYIQREHFSSDQVQAILDGIQDLGQASCVKFRPYKKGDRDAVVIQGSRRGCFSQVGYQGGYQVLNLSARHPVGRGCFRHGTVVHELLHTLGFYHMQSSPDRDEFIDVLWENIIEPAKHNFRKYNSFSVSDFGVGYDYDSVLHYSKRAFSSNGKPTLLPKQSGASIGQRVGLSDKDTQKLNKMYCDAESNNNDQAEPPRKSTIIKKKPKDQPFQGHGIGYYQGKTVVIKVPTAETLKLPERPSYHKFDYFSKTSQALPTPFAVEQGFGTKKALNDKTPASVTTINSDEKETLKKGLHDYRDYKFINITPKEVVLSTTHKNKETIIDEENLDEKNKVVNDTEKVGDSIDDVIKDVNVSDPKLEHELEEAFERLRKIVKARVYPSQSTRTKVYKVDTDYTKYKNPEKEFESHPQIDDIFGSSLEKPKKEIEANRKDDKDSSVEFKKGNNDGNSNVEFINPTYYKEYDSSYGTGLPFRKLLEKEPQFLSTYKIPADPVKLKDIENKNDYSSFYNPKKTKSKSKSNEPYKLLGSPVPLQEPWYKVDEIHPIYQYSSGLSNDKSKLSDKQHNEKYTPNFNAESLKRLAKVQNYDYTSLHNPESEKHYNDDKIQSYSLLANKTEPNTSNSKSDGLEIDSEEDYVYGRNSTSHENYRIDDVREVTEKPITSDSSEEERNDNVSSERYTETEQPRELKAREIPRRSVAKPKEERKIYSEQSSENDKDISNSNENISLHETEELKAAVKKKQSNDDDDYSSFDRSLDDRLSDILSNFAKYDSFDITSPYVGHNESYEEEDNHHGTTESNRHSYNSR